MKIVGSIIFNQKICPFIFDDETNILILDEFSWERANPMNHFEQVELCQKIRESSTIQIDEIRIGKYFCDSCGNWRNATSQEWSYGMCLSCSIDRDSDFAEMYD